MKLIKYESSLGLKN